MPRSPVIAQGQTQSLFLDALTSETFDRLAPHLELVNLPASSQIGRSGEPIAQVFFPVTCAISTVARMSDGTDIEVSLIGNEGFYGVSLAIANARAAYDAMVQLPGATYRMAATDFMEVCRSGSPLMDAVLRYTLVTIETMGQFLGCNRFHPVNERCARWLLMAHDRIEGDVLFLTHEYLASMLGVRRPGVTLALATLFEAGAIDYGRGRIRIKSRAELEAISCECYAFSIEAIARHLGYNARKTQTEAETETDQVREGLPA